MVKYSIKTFLITFLVVLVGCSTTTITPKKEKIVKKKSEELRLGNFDKVYIPNEAPKIAKMISIVQPEIEINFRNKIANNIQSAVKKYNVEPQIIVALIDTESNFHSDKVSTTGDLSIAQVNLRVWNKEFERMKMPLIEKEKLITTDQTYAIHTMTQILSIIKKRFGNKDRRWYARYHSNTKKYKNEYLRRIEVRMKMLSEDKHYILADI